MTITVVSPGVLPIPPEDGSITSSHAASLGRDPDVNSGERFLVYEAGGYGLGHILTTALNCAHMAYTQKYTLALDFSRCSYFSTSAHSQFIENFSFIFPSDLKIITDLSTISLVKARGDVKTFGIDVTSHDLTVGIDTEVLIVPGTLIEHLYVPEMKVAAKYQIGLKGELLNRLTRRLSQTKIDKQTIGIYFRHGNGEYLNVRFDSYLFPDHARLYETLKSSYIKRAKEISEELGFKEPRYFIASDSADFIASMKAGLPNSFSISELVSNLPWTDVVGLHKDDIRALSDAVNDVYCLSFCSYLLYSPSLFPHFAVLNSSTLDTLTAEIMAVPTLMDIIDHTEPELAVIYAKDVLRRMRGFVHRLDHLPQAYQLLERAFTRAGQTTSAQLAFNRREHLNQALWSGIFHKSFDAVSKQDRSEVVAGIDEVSLALQQHPKNPFLHHLLGKLHYLAGDASAAASELQRAIADDPEFPDAYFSLSEVLLCLGDVGNAVAAAQNAVSLDPDDPAARKQLDHAKWLQERELVNVGFRGKAEQSSISEWSRPGEAQNALSGVSSGAFSFHTNFEQSPWWMVDLGHQAKIKSLRIFNRDDGAEVKRAESMVVLLGNDRDGPWIEVRRPPGVFGGILHGEPLNIELSQAHAARFLKLQLKDFGALHLDQVMIYAEDNSA